MSHISGLDRSQLLLLPEAVDDYVGAENPVRFIDAFVAGLDLTVMGLPGYPQGNRPSWLLTGQSFKTLHLWLSEPGTVEPAAGSRSSSQHRGHLAAADIEAGL